jgi:chromosome segregation ATPase
MKNSNLTVEQIENLLKRELKPIKDILESHSETLDSHTKQLMDIKQTQESHSASLANVENRIEPMAETAAKVSVDHSKRIGNIELRLDDLEPRVDAIEAVVAK